jgi:hypothetical protein
MAHEESRARDRLGRNDALMMVSWWDGSGRRTAHTGTSVRQRCGHEQQNSSARRRRGIKRSWWRWGTGLQQPLERSGLGDERVVLRTPLARFDEAPVNSGAATNSKAHMWPASREEQGRGEGGERMSTFIAGEGREKCSRFEGDWRPIMVVMLAMIMRNHCRTGFIVGEEKNRCA